MWWQQGVNYFEHFAWWFRVTLKQGGGQQSKRFLLKEKGKYYPQHFLLPLSEHSHENVLACFLQCHFWVIKTLFSNNLVIFKIQATHQLTQAIRCEIHCYYSIHRNSHYDLRGNDILKLPKNNTTTYGLKSLRVTSAKLWNSLPDSFRTIRSFKFFKNTSRKLDLSGSIQS